jgi:hypothetical protein
MVIQEIDMRCYKMLSTIKNKPPKVGYTMKTESSRSEPY